MDGNPIDALLSADPRQLAQIFVTAPERYDFIDDRLFDLWARVATVGSIPPDLEEPEFGADRFNTARDKLVRAGKSDDDPLLSAAHTTRYWMSTGLFIWKTLRDSPQSLIDRLRRLPADDVIVDLLLSVLWLGGDTPERGAFATVVEACRDTKLVSDKLYEELLEGAEDDQKMRSWLCPMLERSRRRREPASVRVARKCALTLMRRTG